MESSSPEASGFGWWLNANDIFMRDEKSDDFSEIPSRPMPCETSIMQGLKRGHKMSGRQRKEGRKVHACTRD